MNNQNFGSEIGRVLWFDQRKGYGFIKIITPESTNLNKDVFCHYSSIMSENTFKKLYPGEFVSLDVQYNNSVDESKKYQCLNVRGVLGYPLLVDNSENTIKVFKKRVSNNENGDEVEVSDN